MPPLPWSILGLFVTAAATLQVTRPHASTTPTELRVHAGTHARKNAIVPASRPQLPAAGQTYELRDDRDGAIPVQIDGNGTGWRRFVAADGPADRSMLEQLWNDFADPPRVTVR